MAESSTVLSSEASLQPNSPTKPRPRRQCQGAAIQGSSLLSTLEEMRTFLRSNQPIYINGVQYLTHVTKLPSSWPAKCIELSTDYGGETDFNARIDFEVFIHEKSKSKKPTNATAIPTSGATATTSTATASVGIEEIKKKPYGKLDPIQKGEKPANKKQLTVQHKAGEDVAKQNKSDHQSDQQPAEEKQLKPLQRTSSFNKKKKVKPQESQSSVQETATDNNRRSPNQETEEIGGLDLETEDAAASSALLPPEKKLAEARKLARERVLRKIKEEKERAERFEKEQEEKRLKVLETNELKIKLLQEKTLQRVQHLKETEKYKEIEKKEKVYEEQERKQRSQEATQTDEYKLKMEALRRETARRQRQQQLRADKLEEEKQKQIQQKLDEIARKKDVSTTFSATNSTVSSNASISTAATIASNSTANRGGTYHIKGPQSHRKLKKKSNSNPVHTTTGIFNYQGEPGDFFTIEEGDVEEELAEQTGYHASGSMDDSHYLSTAQLQQHNESFRIQTLNRPASEHSHHTYTHSQHSTMSQEAATNAAHLIGGPKYAFDGGQDDASDDMMDENGDLEEDSLLYDDGAQTPLRNDNSASPLRKNSYYATASQQQVSDFEDPGTLKEKPGTWLAKELDESFSDDELVFSPPKVQEDSGKKKKKQVRIQEDSSDDDSSVMSDLTDHEGKRIYFMK